MLILFLQYLNTLPQASLVSLSTKSGALDTNTSVNRSAPEAQYSTTRASSCLATEELRQLRTVDAAKIVAGDRFPLRAILRQQAKQIRNAELSAVARDQRIQTIPPCPFTPAARPA